MNQVVREIPLNWVNYIQKTIQVLMPMADTVSEDIRSTSLMSLMQTIATKKLEVTLNAKGGKSRILLALG